MAQWVALDDEALAWYQSGELVPLDVRETEHGVEVWMPHDFPERRNVHRICQTCGLMPFDYDAIEVPCKGGE